MQVDFHGISALFVYGGVASALVIAIDTATGRRPAMKIMIPVWILTGLWASFLGLAAYFCLGRRSRSSDRMNGGKMNHENPPSLPVRPDPADVGISTLHCGAGCTLADLIGETVTLGMPLAIAGSRIAGQWTLDYVLALLFGILFQYAAIQPMLHLPAARALGRALKIDFLSLTAWQTGMYGWMLVMMLFLFPAGLSKLSVEFWFMMQVAMLTGFLFSYPVNWWLIRRGTKPSM